MIKKLLREDNIDEGEVYDVVKDLENKYDIIVKDQLRVEIRRNQNI